MGASGLFSGLARRLQGERVSVVDMPGFVGNGTNDDRAAVLMAASLAATLNKKLFCPAGYTVRLSATTDLRGVRQIEFLSDVLVAAGTMIFGGIFNIGKGRYRFADVTNGTSTFGAPPAQPVARAVGLSESEVTIGACNYLQLYADATVGGSNDRACAYNTFNLLGNVRLLELTDANVAGSYTNENFIYANRIIALRIRGQGYNHNHNKIFQGCFEGSDVALTFENCSMNQVYGARFESVGSAPGVTFDSQTFCNRVFFTWSGAGSPEDDFRNGIPVTDNGRGNMVSSESATVFQRRELWSVNAQSGILGTAAACIADDPRIAPPARGFSTLSTPAILVPSLAGFEAPANAFIALSEPIPVRLGDVIEWDADYTGALMRPVVYVLDADQKPLLSEGGGGAFYQQVDCGTFDTTNGFYGSSAPLTAAQLRPGAIRRSEVRFVRVGIWSSVGGFVRHIGASIYTQALDRGFTQGAAARTVRIRSLPATPTRGLPTEGQAVLCGGTWRTATRVAESTLSAGLAAGATSATVASASGAANADIVGILLDNGTTHWTTVSALATNTFTIAAIPAGRSAPSGGRVVFVRWA